MPAAKFFLDTNILIYTLDVSAPVKRDIAKQLVFKALSEQCGCISYQVTQESLNVILRRPRHIEVNQPAERFLHSVLQPLCKVFPHDAFFEHALGIQSRWRYSFYDSLIITAALQTGCETLYSEDLQHEQKIETLIVINPFVN